MYYSTVVDVHRGLLMLPYYSRSSSWNDDSRYAIFGRFKLSQRLSDVMEAIQNLQRHH